MPDPDWFSIDVALLDEMLFRFRNTERPFLILWVEA